MDVIIGARGGGVDRGLVLRGEVVAAHVFVFRFYLLGSFRRHHAGRLDGIGLKYCAYMPCGENPFCMGVIRHFPY